MIRKASLFVLSGLLVLSSFAYGDTYNFFFDEAKNKRKKQDQVSPAPEMTQAPESVSPGGQAPIEIHNNVTSPGPTSPPQPDPKQSVPPPVVTPNASASAVMTAPVSMRPSRWKVGFGPMLSSVPYYPVYPSSYYSYGESRTDRPALVLSLGYRFMPAFGVNTFMGLHQKSDWNPVFGADLEAFPIRVDVGRFDLFEVGVLAGASNILSAASSGGIVPHVGARLNINLGSHVTLTTAMRLAEKFHSTEWSLAFNI